VQNLNIPSSVPRVRWPSEHNARVAAASSHPPRDGENVDWSCRLFDSDGYEHSLVVLGGVQVVTKLAFAYVVWDRRVGQCVSHLHSGDGPLAIGNEPMSDLERHRRQVAAVEALRQMYPSGDPRLVALESQLGVSSPAPRLERERPRGG
jgi:hypothetical protein